MILWYRLLALLALSLVAACAPATRITLLPEDGNTVGALELTTAAGSATLNRAYQTADVDRHGALQLGLTSAQAVRARHPQVMDMQAAPAVRFTLYFAEGGARLTPESEALLADVMQRAAERPGGEIVVTGHTDTTGSADANDALSLKRARYIRDLLIARGFQGDLIQAIGRGQRELRIPTGDAVDEPRNRRAEVVVR